MVAQVGLRVQYGQVSNSNWEESSIPNSCDCFIPQRNYKSIALDYMIRHKEKRIEFYPALTYVKTDEFGFSEFDQNIHHTESIRLIFNTQLYPLDFHSDCDCPTWSKDNDFFKKGFFIFIAPEIGVRNHKGRNADSSLKLSNQGMVYGISGGIGLDIGISELLTLSPILRVGYLASSTWKNFIETDLSDKTNYYGLELRLGFNL